MRPTWRRVWPGQPPVRKFADCNVAITTGTKGTFFHDGIDSKLANTAPMKKRFETLKKHGADAFRKTFK